jgi:thioredoxin 1
MAKDVDSKSFKDQVLDSDQIVLVDFWAEWCPPCRALSPIIKKVADKTDKAKVVKLNVDENPDVAMKYGIRGIPTVLVFKDGEVAETVVGLQPESAYDSLIEKHS